MTKRRLCILPWHQLDGCPPAVERARWLERVLRTTCSECGASWEGTDYGPCTWCERKKAGQRDLLRRIALEPPDLVHGVKAHEIALQLSRLADGLQSGVISEAEAERAMRLTTRWLTTEVAA